MVPGLWGQEAGALSQVLLLLPEALADQLLLMHAHACVHVCTHAFSGTPPKATA